MIDKVIGLLSPHICEGCGAVGSALCKRCNNHILSNPYAKCLICLSPVGQKIMTRNGQLCAKCKVNSAFDKAYIVGARKEVLSRLVGNFKYLSRRGSASQIAKLLSHQLPPDAPLFVVYIPTSPRHIRERGFDHMRAVANSLARERNMQVLPALRRRNNDSQHTANKSDRLRLAQTSFSVHAKNLPEKLLLIDDIYTTGATTQTAARLLRKSGAKEIWLAVVARQEPK